MDAHEIIKLGTKLGLPFKLDSNFEYQLAEDYVVFDGSNGQRFAIDGKLTDDEIYRCLGAALIQYGMRLKVMDIERVMSITGDTTQLPINLS